MPKELGDQTHMRATEARAKWSERTRALVAQIYAADFAILNYDPSVLPPSCVGVCGEVHASHARECELCGTYP